LLKKRSSFRLKNGALLRFKNGALWRPLAVELGLWGWRRSVAYGMVNYLTSDKMETISRVCWIVYKHVDRVWIDGFSFLELFVRIF
jgi:hypothetical protein